LTASGSQPSGGESNTSAAGSVLVRPGMLFMDAGEPESAAADAAALGEPTMRGGRPCSGHLAAAGGAGGCVCSSPLPTGLRSRAQLHASVLELSGPPRLPRWASQRQRGARPCSGHLAAAGGCARSSLLPAELRST
jgi:hypothetical protein